MEGVSEELVEKLNMLLEAERAGVKVCASFSQELTDEALQHRVRDIGRDEAKHCSDLDHVIRQLGGEPSAATGEFAEKFFKVKGDSERMSLLFRGLRWTVREISRLLAGSLDEHTRRFLERMLREETENMNWAQSKSQAQNT